MGFDAYEDGAEVLQLLVVCVANGLLFQEDVRGRTDSLIGGVEAAKIVQGFRRHGR